MCFLNKLIIFIIIFQYDPYQNETGFINNNGSNNIDPRPPPQQYLQPQTAMMEDAASGPSPRDRAFENNRPSPPPAQNRPQARVPPTPVYRPPRGGPVPSPPNQTPQRPHAIRQQQPLPPSHSRVPPHPPQPRESTPPSARESPPLSSKSEITGDILFRVSLHH